MSQMNWQYLFSGYEQWVDDIIDFFTSKATNPELHQEIVRICKTETEQDRIHDVRLGHGYLWVRDFVDYRASFTPNGQRYIPFEVLQEVLSRLCKASILFQSVSFRDNTDGDRPYSVNEPLAQYLYSRDLIKNVIFGFNYIAERYSKSVFKIIVKADNGDESTGTGFLHNVEFEDDLCSVVITNRHVAQFQEDLQILSNDNHSMHWKNIFLADDKQLDLAVIVLDVYCDFPPFYLLADPILLDEIITMGYPDIPLIRDPYQVVHKGEINAFVDDYWNNKYLLFSAKTSPGNSGGPIINSLGQVVGIVTQQLYEEGSLLSKGKLPYNAAIPGRTILDFVKSLFPLN